MARRHRSSRKHHSRRYRKHSTQSGGGWGFNGPAFAPAGGMAPESARALTDDCAVLDRPAPAVTPTGAWSQSGGGCAACEMPQRGGDLSSWFGFGDASDNSTSDNSTSGTSNPTSADAPAPLGSNQEGGRRRRQTGGGGGGGGYNFDLNNTLGKTYAAVPVGPCPSGQRGGGDSLGNPSLVSYPAGYGYAPSSAMEVGGGSAHFLAQIPYGKQCMGGGRRTRRRGARRSRKAHRKSRRHH